MTKTEHISRTPTRKYGFFDSFLLPLSNPGATAFRSDLKTPFFFLMVVPAICFIAYYAITLSTDYIGSFSFHSSSELTRTLVALGGVLFIIVSYLLLVIVAFTAVIFPLMALVYIIEQRHAMATASAANPVSYRHFNETGGKKSAKQATAMILKHILFVEPLFVIRKTWQALSYIVNKLLGKDAHWITEHEKYYLQQIEILRALLIFRNNEEAAYYMFESSYGVHYAPVHELVWFHAKNRRIADNMKANSPSDLKAAYWRWKEGTHRETWRYLDKRFHAPEWLRLFNAASTEQERLAALKAPGPCRLGRYTITGIARGPKEEYIYDVE